MSRRSGAKLLSVFLLGSLLSGCVTTRFPSWDEKLETQRVGSAQEAKKAESEGDSLFERRKDLKMLEASLLKWELANHIEPSEKRLEKLAKAHYLLGERVLGQDATKSKSDRHFTLGLDCAEKGLLLVAPEMVKEIKRGGSMKKAIAKAPQAAASLLYWYAMNLDRWARIKGILTTMRYREVVDVALVRALDFEDGVEASAQMSDSRNKSTR